MSKLFLFASSLCCLGRVGNNNHKEDKVREVVEIREENPLIDKFNDDILIWALKYHITKNYEEKKTLIQQQIDTSNEILIFDPYIGSNTLLGLEEEKVIVEGNKKSAKICSDNFDENNSSYNNSLLKIPKLNLDALQPINYDSEKEHYTDYFDKLKKIKKRFELIK